MGFLDDFLTGGQGKANKWNKNLMGLANQSYEDARAEMRQGGARGRGDLLRALLSLQEGADASRGEINRMGDVARTNVMDAQTAAGGQIQQGLVDSGFSSSTVGPALQRGLATDTSRALMNIDSNLAGMFADLEMRLGEGLAAGHTNLGQMEQGTAAGVAGLHEGQGLNYSNYFSKGGQSGLSMLADIAGVGSSFGLWGK